MESIHHSQLCYYWNLWKLKKRWRWSSEQKQYKYIL